MVVNDFGCISQPHRRRSKGSVVMSIALWVVQGLLALLFLFAGLTKAFFPLPTVKKQFRFREPRARRTGALHRRESNCWEGLG